jgi:hypothetical protein
LSAADVANLHDNIIQSNAGIAPQAAQESLSEWNPAAAAAGWANNPDNFIGNVGGYFGVSFGNTQKQDEIMDGAADLASYGSNTAGDLADQRWAGAGWTPYGPGPAPTVGVQVGPTGLLGSANNRRSGQSARR